MKKLVITFLAASVSVSQAIISLTGGAVFPLGDENGVGLTTSTEFAVVVSIDPNVNTFSGLLENETVSVGSIIGDGEFFVLETGQSLNFGGAQGAQAVVTGFDTSGTVLANNAAAGNQVGFLWFPELSTTDSVLDANDSYGVFTAADWVLPPSGGFTDLSSASGAAILPASFQVQPIPEPSSTALLGLGGLALFARRRRV